MDRSSPYTSPKPSIRQITDVIPPYALNKKSPIKHVPVKEIRDAVTQGSAGEQPLSAFMIDPKYLSQAKKQDLQAAPQQYQMASPNFHATMAGTLASDRIRRPRMVSDHLFDADEEKPRPKRNLAVMGALAAMGALIARKFGDFADLVSNAWQRLRHHHSNMHYSLSTGAHTKRFGLTGAPARFAVPLALVGLLVGLGLFSSLFVPSPSTPNDTGRQAQENQNGNSGVVTDPGQTQNDSGNPQNQDSRPTQSGDSPPSTGTSTPAQNNQTAVQPSTPLPVGGRGGGEVPPVDVNTSDVQITDTSVPANDPDAPTTTTDQTAVLQPSDDTGVVGGRGAGEDEALIIQPGDTPAK